MLKPEETTFKLKQKFINSHLPRTVTAKYGINSLHTAEGTDAPNTKAESSKMKLMCITDHDTCTQHICSADQHLHNTP
jgi:hypothetical protein